MTTPATIRALALAAPRHPLPWEALSGSARYPGQWFIRPAGVYDASVTSPHPASAAACKDST